MSASTRWAVFVSAISAVLLVAALPALAQTPAGNTTSGSGPGGWADPDKIIALIVAITSLIVAITGLVRGTSAQAKSDANEQRINAVSTRLDAHGQQITDLAKEMVPPSMLPQILMTGQPNQAAPFPPPASPQKAELNRL